MTQLPGMHCQAKMAANVPSRLVVGSAHNYNIANLLVGKLNPPLQTGILKYELCAAETSPAPILKLACSYMPRFWAISLAYWLGISLSEGGTLLPVGKENLL